MKELINIVILTAVFGAFSVNGNTIVYDFENGSTQGWTTRMESTAVAGYYDLAFGVVRAEHGWDAATNNPGFGNFFLGQIPGTNDDRAVAWTNWPATNCGVHQTLWIESTPFFLDGSGDLTFFGAGSEGAINPKYNRRNYSLINTPIPLVAGTWGPESGNPSETSGTCAVGLRRDDGVFVLSRSFRGFGSNWSAYSFTAAELQPYVNDGHSYTLNLVDFIAGTSAWCAIDNVRIPGRRSLEPEGLPGPGERGIVRCLKDRSWTYDIYLPPAYSTNGPPLPIIFTFHPNGGGMVSELQNACSKLNIILVGLINSRNGQNWDQLFVEYYPVSDDVRRRVFYDPTAEFLGGFSGGGECSYMLSRCNPQHIAGLYEISGWMGRYYEYYSTDRVLTNLLVARVNGVDDYGDYILPYDAGFLATCGAVINDWTFPGGHQVPPDSVSQECLSWLVNNRIPAGATDRTNAEAQEITWRARVRAGETEGVLRECATAMMEHPRSWIALKARLVLDDLMDDYESLRPLTLDNLAQGDYALDFLYFMGHHAGLTGNWPRYRSCLKLLTGITGVSGDRAGNIREMLLSYGHPAPILEYSAKLVEGMSLRLVKQAPGLDYGLESRSDLVSDGWKPAAFSILESNVTWSVEVTSPSESKAQFFRAKTAPSDAPPPQPMP